MPTRLPSGTVVYNVTPHRLFFWVGEGVPAVIAESDGIVNAIPKTTDVLINSRYTLAKVMFTPTVSGRRLISEIRREQLDALIVGSIIAAQAYPGEVVSTVPMFKGRGNPNRNTEERVVRSDRFTIFPKEKQNGN